ncbi:hypothetical protein HGRIS_000612 [Hohenbuehelia grisea]|uniref:DUF6534 domain-containing protein n=1 Tax=Hohenbuehelia grisea TaxID=104357 RepID=A0ABR3JRI4_9AGAR
MIVAVSTPIQIFFAWRIKVITQSYWAAVLVALLALVSLGGGVWTSVMIGIIKRFARKPELHTPALVWFLSACVADVIITISLCRSLSQRKTGMAVTDDILNKIIRMTVQTGMITAIAAVGDVVFFMVFPRAALNFLWDLALSKLYVNCLLSTLNARAALNNISNGPNMLTSPSFQSPNTRRQHHISTMEDPESGSYELRSKHLSVSPHSAKSREFDLASGIQVTTVVERLEQ